MSLPIAAGDTPIPRTVHFVWFQGEAHLRQHEPGYWANVQRTRELFGEGWDVKLWDEPAVVRVIEQAAPHVMPRFAALDEPAMKADIARFALMKVYGGIYLDIDFIVYRSLEPLCRLTTEPYVALRRLRFANFIHAVLNGTLRSTPESLQTYVIISSAGHPVWDRLLDHIARFRRRRFLEPRGLYYTRFTCLNALGRAVYEHRLQYPQQFPVLHITHVSDFFGSHIGLGTWAGVLTTYGGPRRTLVSSLNWICVLSLVANVLLLLLLALAIARS